MNFAVSQTNFANNDLWRNLSCNWLWCAFFLLCCLLMSINAASSNTPQHAYPLIQTLPQPTTSVLVRSQLQRQLTPARPQVQPPKTRDEKKRTELDGVT